MGYPVLEINVRKIEENVAAMVKFMRERGIEPIAVNKVFNGDAETAMAAARGGAWAIAESRVYNLKKIAHVPCKKVLLRITPLSDVYETVTYADISLNSERAVIKALSDCAVMQGKNHGILLMIDMGDIREGIWFERLDEIEDALRFAKSLPNLTIEGIGTNFTCFGTVVPTIENNERFVAIAREMERRLDMKLRYLSACNCTSAHLIEDGVLPAGINNIRTGGYHLFGQSYMNGHYNDIFHHSKKPPAMYVSDLFIFKAEVIEMNTKPTVPVGQLGVDAFMQKKTFEDKGWRKRAILAFGRQDVGYDNLSPVDESIKLLGQSSDHTIADIHDCETDYKVGDIIPFEVDYTALLQLMNGGDLEKVYVRT